MIVLQKRNVEPVKSPDHPLGRVFGSSCRSVLPPLSPPFANTRNVIKYLGVVASLPTDPPFFPFMRPHRLNIITLDFRLQVSSNIPDVSLPSPAVPPFCYPFGLPEPSYQKLLCIGFGSNYFAGFATATIRVRYAGDPRENGGGDARARPQP
jgi:hypothetical protein